MSDLASGAVYKHVTPNGVLKLNRCAQIKSRSRSNTKMRLQRKIVILLLLLVLGSAAESSAQRKAVSGTEVTGTFRSYFKGKFRGSYNEILIQALGRNKLKIEMGLVYPHEVNGEQMANVGAATGEALIAGDTAVFVPDYAKEQNEPCKITLRFTKPGTLVVSTENNLGCGFGFNVEADGTYRKTSSAKPKFTTEER